MWYLWHRSLTKLANNPLKIKKKNILKLQIISELKVVLMFLKYHKTLIKAI